MSTTKKAPLFKIEIKEGKKTKLYLVPKETARAVATLLDGIKKTRESSTPAEEIFPDLKDPSKHPMITFRGIRLKSGLNQKKLAQRIGITQSDVSHIERGKRAIGKKLAKRIEKEFRIDFRRFL